MSSSIQSQSPPQAQITPRQRLTALLLAALCGAAIMVVELGVARILTPVFGGSISVWAIVIATTMLALALGYAVGGVCADRWGGIRIACLAAGLGALLCALIPYMRRPLIAATVELPTLAGASLATLVMIAPCLFLLGQVSPALIRGLTRGTESKVGSNAGKVYAISTLGSLAGTLAAVWLFLYFPLAPGFVGTALLLCLPLLLLTPALGAATALLLVGLLWLAPEAPSASSAMNQAGQEARLIAQQRSAYGELRVIELDRRYRYLVVNGADQGGIEIATGASAYHYDDGLLGLGRLFVHRPRNALVIGLGAGLLSGKLEALGTKVDNVEIDPAVVTLAQRHFGFEGTAIIADGRRYLQRSDQHWDLILVDAFLGGNPPWQLFTREAFELYRRHLSPRGAVVLNLIGSHTDPEQRPALAAVAATAEAVFEQVEVYPDPWEPANHSTRNLFIAAARHPRLRPKALGSPSAAFDLGQAIARSQPLADAALGGRILSDGSAPLGPLSRRTSEILRSRTLQYLPLEVLLF